MMVLDANLLLYAYMPKAPQHKAASRWLRDLLSSDTEVGIPLQSAMAFLRIATNRSVPLVRLDMDIALGIAEGWFEQPFVRLLYPGEAHWPFLRRMLLEGHADGPLGSDAHLAAITMECAGTLYTTDSDFARFPGLHWRNPLKN